MISSIRLTCLALFVLCSTACADNRSSLFIRGMMVTTPPNCDVTASGTARTYFRGVLDVAFRFNYQGAILVGNQLAARGNSNSLRTEVNRLPLEGAEVLLTDADGELENGFFSVAASGFVDVSSGTSPGYGAIQATLIPDVVGNDIANDLAAQGLGARREVIASVRVFGRTLGGIDIESSDFTFPIDVCYGCLVDYPADALIPDQGAPSGFVCEGNPESAPEPPCGRGQDVPLDCRHCLASDICRFP